MKRVILFAAMAWFLSAPISVGIAQTKKVIRKSLPPLIGTVTQKDGEYEVMTPSGPIRVPADEVVSITDHVTFEQEYSRRVLALEPDDVEGRYALAQWCMGQKELNRAQEELLAALKLKPDHENARLLLQLVKAEIAESTKPRTLPPPGQREVIPGTRIPMTAIVSNEEVMRIRLAELRSRDRVSVAFRNRVDVRFADQMKGVGPFADPEYRRVFLTKPAVARAVEILVTLPNATELHRDILVRTNPRFMSTFKSRIWPMVAKNCASTKCHGGAKGAGRLKLFNVRSSADTIFFTNYLILDAFESHRGRMIDRSHPSRSLLLQFGLPADEARATHPGEIRAMYRGVEDSRYRLVEAWIKEDLIHPHPKYDIKYKVPGRRTTPLINPGSPIPPVNPAQPARPLRAKPDRDAGGGG